MRPLAPVIRSSKGEPVFRCDHCGAATAWVPPGPDPLEGQADRILSMRDGGQGPRRRGES